VSEDLRTVSERPRRGVVECGQACVSADSSCPVSGSVLASASSVMNSRHEASSDNYVVRDIDTV